MVSALQPRAYAVDDRVAYAEREPEKVWRLGTVAGVSADPWGAESVAIRYDDGDVAYLPAEDRRLVPADEVPLDERGWLPQSVRDALARQEAAGRLRAMAAALPACTEAAHVRDLADQLDDVLDPGIDDELPAAAWELLTPVPVPAL